jgi:hypothetical protein
VTGNRASKTEAEAPSAARGRRGGVDTAMDSDGQYTPARPPASLRRTDVLLAAAAGVAVTAAVVCYSARHYRLLRDIEYDDCGYFADGFVRLTTLRTQGIGAFVSGLFDAPPHAPLQTLTAAAAFSVFGARDWAPYALNAVPYFVLVLTLLYAARALPLVSRVAAVAAGCSVGYTVDAIAVFRPEFPSSAFLGAAVLLIADEPLDRASTRTLVLAGLSWAMSLLAKPTFAPLTACVFASAVALAAIDSGLLHRRPARPRWRMAAAALVPFAAAVPLLLLYFPFAWRDLVEYVHAAQFGPTSAVWRVDLSLTRHLLYYLTGSSGVVFLGRHLYLFAALVLASLAAATVRRDHDARRRLVRLLVPAAFGYAIVTANPHKQYFFGWGFQVLLTVAAVAALAQLAAPVPGRGRRAAVICGLLPVAAAAVGLFLFRAPRIRERDGTGHIAALVRDKLLGDAAPGRPLAVYLPSAEGAINVGTFQWLSLRDGSSGKLAYASAMMSDDLADQLARCGRADAVVLPRFDGPANFLPSSRICNELARRLDADPSFVRTGTYPRPKHEVLVYKRATPVATAPSATMPAP